MPGELVFFPAVYGMVLNLDERGRVRPIRRRRKIKAGQTARLTGSGQVPVGMHDRRMWML